jgi:hypothetical protein
MKTKAVVLVLYVAITVVTISSHAHAQERYFYKGRNYGSEALFNPINLILNSGYGIMQMEGHSREIMHLPYKQGAKNLWRNLRSPFGPISRYGWGNFASNELFPLHISKTHAQWLPNYQLHLIGGGMSSTAMYEWYDLHRYPIPRVFAISTMATSHIINEIIENGPYQGDNVDPIADIYFFDIAGIILFSFDGINRFFSENVVIADWSLMPSLAPRDMTLQNNGQNFSFKWKLPFAKQWSLFHYYGLQGLTGASYRVRGDDDISLGLGLRSKSREILDQQTRRMTVDLVWNGGLFYDRQNSLLCSLLLSGQPDKALILNVYPGVARIGQFSPGLWLILNSKGQPTIGAITSWAPGLAIK